MRTSNLYNHVAGRHYGHASFLERQQHRFAVARKAVTAARGGGVVVPVIANGLGNGYFPHGQCDVTGDCATLEDMAAAFDSSSHGGGGFVDGWISEGFYGNEDVSSCRDNLDSGTIQLHDPDTWVASVQSLAWSAQNGVAAFPIIFQAGCKSPILEYQPRPLRDAYEEGGYASFLLAVERGSSRSSKSKRTRTRKSPSTPSSTSTITSSKSSASSRGKGNPITFGINTMYRSTPTGAGYAYLHPRYTWAIGEPAESYLVRSTTPPASNLIDSRTLRAVPPPLPPVTGSAAPPSVCPPGGR